jgi:hypothetical protein
VKGKRAGPPQPDRVEAWMTFPRGPVQAGCPIGLQESGVGATAVERFGPVAWMEGRSYGL